jgi:hypothetical protein
MLFSHGTAAILARPRDFAASVGFDLGLNYVILQVPDDAPPLMRGFRYERASFLERVNFLGSCISSGRICCAKFDSDSEKRLPTGDSLLGKSLADVGRPAPNKEAFLAEKWKDPEFERFVNPSMIGACQVKHQEEKYPSILYDAVDGGPLNCRARNVSFFNEKHFLRFLIVVYDLNTEALPHPDGLFRRQEEGGEPLVVEILSSPP